MQTATQTANPMPNPFLMMMEPEAVLRAMARSTDLRRLRHHKYRPLDRPWIPLVNVRKTAESLVNGASRARLDA